MTHARLIGAAALVGILSLTAPALADTAPPTAAQAQAPAVQAQGPAARAQGPATPGAAAPVTDVELRNFAAARAEIEPLNAQPQSAATLTQMRTSLQNHSLTGVRYNEIVAAVQSDPALQRRLAALAPARSASPPG